MNDGIDFPGFFAKPKPVVQPLAVHSFDAGKRAWTDSPTTRAGASAAEITFVTFNTWFQGEDKELRYLGLLDVLRDSDADVIFLQEVTELLLENLLTSEWVREHYQYARSPFRSDAIPSHGTMLLSRLPVFNATLHPIPTRMGRSLLTAESSIDGRQFVFATAHLESMKSHADTRGEQLQAIFALLESAQDVVFAGDFNFCSSWPEENGRIDARYIDIWPHLRPHEPGYTQDTDLNAMLARAKRETKKVRIDRVLLRSDSARWIPNSVRLIGTAPVSAKHSRVFPSDHFGLCGTIRRVAC